MRCIFQKGMLMVLMTILFVGNVDAQESKLLKNLSLEYGAQLPFADMKKRFGFNFQLGGHLEVITIKSNWVFGASFHTLFGRVVNEDVLVNLRTTEGEIIGNDRQFAAVSLRQRGIQFQFYGGKIFPILKKHPLSGIKFTIGAGLLQHKIRVQDDTRTVTELTGEYLKGYDRLTNGFAITPFLGYQHLDRRGRINVLIGVDLNIAFTKNRRDYDFALLQKLDDNRLDILAGLKAGFIVPIGSRLKSADDIIY